MGNLVRHRARTALVDVSRYGIALDTGGDADLGALPSAVASLLQGGHCACYGAGRVLRQAGLDVDADREVAYRLLEAVFREAVALLPVERYSVTDRPMTIGSMDIDGFNLNESFSHDGQIQQRAFQTVQALHFDAATPFIGNIYGPNRNIVGGHPLVCDVRQYCLDRGLDPASVVETIPNNYNVRIREEHYAELLDTYTHAYELDLETDIAIMMFLNEIAYGVAHGATDPQKRVASEPAERPIRHLEMQYAEEEHYAEWYDHYGLTVGEVGDYAGEDLSLYCYGAAERPLDKLVGVAGAR